MELPDGGQSFAFVNSICDQVNKWDVPNLLAS